MHYHFYTIANNISLQRSVVSLISVPSIVGTDTYFSCKTLGMKIWASENVILGQATTGYVNKVEAIGIICLNINSEDLNLTLHKKKQRERKHCDFITIKQVQNKSEIFTVRNLNKMRKCIMLCPIGHMQWFDAITVKTASNILEDKT